MCDDPSRRALAIVGHSIFLDRRIAMIQRSGKTLVPALAALALLFAGSVAFAQQ